MFSGEFCKRCGNALNRGDLICRNCLAETPLTQRDPHRGTYQGAALAIMAASWAIDKFWDRSKALRNLSNVSEYHLAHMEEAFEQKDYRSVLLWAEPIHLNRRLLTRLDVKYRYLFGASLYMLERYRDAYKALRGWALDPDPITAKMEGQANVALTFAAACLQCWAESEDDVFRRDGLSAIDKAIAIDPKNPSYKNFKADLLKAMKMNK
jgi:hypothetical protein